MKRISYIIILLYVIAACGGPKSSKAAVAPQEPAVQDVQAVPEGPDTVFVAIPIPPEVEARMRGISYPDDATIALEDLRYLQLSYIDFNGESQNGELVCNKLIADDLVAIFRELYIAQYQICSIRLIDEFGGSDDASMAVDNTSCFNYRPAVGSQNLSNHALGLAIDVNPLENPYVKNGKVLPPEGTPFADRTQSFAHKIDKDDLCYRLFTAHGFTWGGSWQSLKDYQHFEKTK